MTIRLQTFRRDIGLDQTVESRQHQMFNELDQAKRDPTLEEIEAMCAEIREGWSEREHWVRRGCPGGQPAYTVPRVRNMIENEDIVNYLELAGIHLSDSLMLAERRRVM